ncbi:MAG: TerC/Alx family metal homeostasis membrane protein [Ignavibacteriaceae bacterium]|nr:TerC/Alx family metal homeostasis membrane protein [Ignavibacteriaceae bacterium]
MFNEFTFWILFGIIVSILFFIDLYVTEHRQSKITFKSSIIWSGTWIITALLFDLCIYLFLKQGHTRSLDFLTGFIVEKSLSVDNLFIFLMIFKVMAVPAKSQPHVLKWGILSAIVFRIIFILTGIGLIKLFHPVIYLFGFILLYGAYKMAYGEDKELEYEKNPLIKIATKYLNFKPGFYGKYFFVKNEGKVFATSMFLTFLLIESSDIIFAVDSIPAVIAITRDSFIIISSNIFAILGLRALYFVLAQMVDKFIYLKYGVALILLFVGIKMIASDYYPIPTIISLIIILTLLTGSILLSLILNKIKQD